MSADGLRRALAELGVDCDVEARDKLAVIIPLRREIDLGDPTLRRAALALLPAHGFTHLALEIPDTSGDRAALSGD